MSDLEICRICLCKGVKMYNYIQFELKQLYEQLLGKKVYEIDGLPHYFCYECAAMLYKFQKFKEKCCTGEQALYELMFRGPVTEKTISEIDRLANNLKSPIDILYVSKRVRTYIVKDKSESKVEINKINEIKLLEIEEGNNDSDSSIDDKNLAEINDKKTDGIIEEEKKSDTVTTELFNEEKINSNFDDERIVSEDDDVFNTATENDINELITEELNLENSELNDNTEQKDSENKNTAKNGKEKRRNNSKPKDVRKKAKRFEMSESKSYLDPTHWLKINLNEEEALEEFRSRAKDPKFLSAAYQCTDCYKGFSKEDMRDRHIKLRHSESLGPVVCHFCKMRFKIKSHLSRHKEQHYTKYQCLRCDLMCPLKTTALFHNDYHNGVTRQCEHCGDEFRHLSSYYTHLRTHRSEHLCTLCGASFVSNMGLKMHTKTMHVNTVVNPEEKVNIYCERCDIKFETQKAYDQHKFHSAKHCEEIDGDLVSKETSVSSLAKYRKNKSGRKNPRIFTSCTICSQNFPSYTAYLKHHAAEHNDKPLPPKGEPRQICEICGASLAANSVASHLNTHTREKLYSCSTCGIQFNSKGSVNRHQLTHTGEKPFECTMCYKRFTQKNSMKLHYRTVHLKEPYPKRNRRKKTSIQQELGD